MCCVPHAGRVFANSRRAMLVTSMFPKRVVLARAWNAKRTRFKKNQTIERLRAQPSPNAKKVKRYRKHLQLKSKNAQNVQSTATKTKPTTERLRAQPSPNAATMFTLRIPKSHKGLALLALVIPTNQQRSIGKHRAQVCRQPQPQQRARQRRRRQPR